MARKISKPAAPPAPPPPPENELETLHPERELVFGKRKVVVREYGHVEWLRLLPQAEPLVAAIAAALEQGRDPTYEEALACLAQHIDALAPLIAQAAGLALADYEQLDPEQGEVLLMTWWGVNGRFFVGRALNRVAVSMRESANRKALQAAADSLATQRSSPA